MQLNVGMPLFAISPILIQCSRRCYKCIYERALAEVAGYILMLTIPGSDQI